LKRRSFLKGVGAVTVVAVGGGVWRAHDKGVFSVGKGPAYEPWDNWRAESNKGPLELVAAAILAANPFNTQPWLFKVTDSSIELYADNPRNTGKFDPYLRELRIGLGCALENLMLAASANGYKAALTLLPGKLAGGTERPDRELVARIELLPGKREETELYRAIPHRHTNRFPYDPQKPVPSEFVEVLSRIADEESNVRIQLFTSDADKNRFVDTCTQAVIQDSPNIDAKSGTSKWIRSDWHEVQQQRDGSFIDDAGVTPMRAAMIKFLPDSLMQLLTPRPSADLTTLIKGSYTNLLMTGRLFGLIAVRDMYDQQQSILAGRVWQRAHLLATARGLAARPANQPVQLVDHQKMYGKAPDEQRVLAQLTGDDSWHSTFMFYMGYPIRQATPTARRPVQAVTI